MLGLAALLAVPVPSIPRIVRLLVRVRVRGWLVSTHGATAAARLVVAHTPVSTLPTGDAGRAVQRQNLLRRAQYLLAASRRLTRDLGVRPAPEQVIDAVRKETRYLRQHLHAVGVRSEAADAADAMASTVGGTDPTTRRPGVVLGWQATLDERTSPECRAAHGKNFLLTQLPAIGLPGAVHPHCRCRPRRPWPTRKLVGGGLLPAVPRSRDDGPIAAANTCPAVELASRY